MKIIHTLHWVQFAGTERVCVDLCNEMSKQNEVVVLSNKDISAYLQENVKFINFNFEKNRYNPLFLMKTARLLDELGADIIQAHNTKELEIMRYAMRFCKKKIPIVATRHNAEFKKKFALADLGVGVSEETMKFINSKKNILITNGANYKNPKFIKISDKFSILGVGRLSDVKGWELLIKALARVKFDFKLVILGDGDDREKLQNLINSLNLQEKVELRGFVENVQDFVYSCDLQVIASKEEGLSITLIEAIFYAKLLIASNIANHDKLIGKELVFDRDEEILASKLDEIHENYDKFVEIFSQVKAKKNEFSQEKMAKKYLVAYQNLIKEFQK